MIIIASVFNFGNFTPKLVKICFYPTYMTTAKVGFVKKGYGETLTKLYCKLSSIFNFQIWKIDGSAKFWPPLLAYHVSLPKTSLYYVLTTTDNMLLSVSSHRKVKQIRCIFFPFSPSNRVKISYLFQAFIDNNKVEHTRFSKCMHIASYDTIWPG